MWTPQLLIFGRKFLDYIARDHEACDIYNMDKTGLFFRALPDNLMKGCDCVGGRKSKKRVMC